jgi:hypothetical protein
MTRPTYLCLKRDPGTNWPKFFMRTFMYSTGAKGLAVENLFLRVRKDDESYRFDFWDHSESGKLTVGSGLFVGPTGVVADHHFNLRGSPDTLLFAAGTYTVEVFAVLIRGRFFGRGGNPMLTEIEFDIDGQQSAELIQILSRELHLYWDADERRYVGEIRIR